MEGKYRPGQRENFPTMHRELDFFRCFAQGLGAVSEGTQCRGPWNLQDSKRHINDLELIAAFNALKAFVGRDKGLSVNLFLDNTTAVAYINKGGGFRSRSLNKIASDMFIWCEARSIAIHATYIPGKSNVLADFQSRAGPDPSDWKLDAAIFEKIRSWSGVNVDLFASDWNKQLPTFVSWQPQPGAVAVNAFAIDWGGHSLFYAFPPFNLIIDCLAKTRRDHAELILITPLWQGQPWFPGALEMSADVPKIIPAHPQLLTSPLNEPHPLADSLTLVAWSLSGDPSRAQVFRDTCASCSWKESVEPHALRTSRHGTIGVIGAVKGVSIPCQRI